MSELIVWTQWSDLKLPAGVKHCVTDGIHPSDEDTPKVQFFVPRYMGGVAAISRINEMTSLKVIQSPNAGVDDLIPVLPGGVVLCNAKGVHDDSTAELAVGLTIASRRGFATFAEAQVNNKWEHLRRQNLIDAHVAIIGFGNIGKRIKQLLLPFTSHIESFTKSGSEGSMPIANLDENLSRFDVVILILPLTIETQGMFDSKRLALMKDGATLINVARGGVVVTADLLAELNTGRLTAGIDVTDPEPLPENHPLWNAPNLIITPHVGGDTLAFEPRCRKLVEEQLERYVTGEKLINIVK